MPQQEKGVFPWLPPLADQTYGPPGFKVGEDPAEGVRAAPADETAVNGLVRYIDQWRITPARLFLDHEEDAA